MPTPVHCRPTAYEHFEREIRSLTAPAALERAAVAIAMHEMDGVDPETVSARFDRIARRIRGRVQTSCPQSVLAHLHHTLFSELGWGGRERGAYDPYDAYVPALFSTRGGLPVTVALAYRSVAQRVGLRVDGINAPGHFLAAVHADGPPMIVDPIAGGRVLHRDEVFDRIEMALGTEVVRDDRLLPVASPRQWLLRILRNLHSIFAHRGRRADVAAVLEMRSALLKDERTGA